MKLPFDIYAMTNPKTPEDIHAVLNETLQELQNLNNILDADTARMELFEKLKGQS